MIFLNQNFPFAFMLKILYCNYFASLDIAFRARHHDFPAPASSSHGVGGKSRKDGHDEPFRTVLPANGCKAERTRCAANRRLSADRKPHGCALLWFALCQQILRRHFCLSSNHSEGAMWPLWGQKVANQEAAAYRWGREAQNFRLSR